MKKTFIYFTAALASVLALTNCSREEVPSQNDYEGTVPFSINAGAPSLKTANDGAFGTDWVADDAINLFYASAGKTDYLTADKFTIASEDLPTNTFRGFLVSELEDGASYDWFVVYPYNAATTAPGKALVNVASAVQTQTGDDNLAHIAGANYPVCGKAKAVAASASPEIAMQHLTSLVEVVVTNASAAPLTVSAIKLVADEAIVGEFSVDITKDAPSYTASAADKVSSTATLNVTGAKELATGASAKYYFAVKPFTAKNGSTLTISVNGIERILEMTKDVTFTAGLKKEIKFEYDLVLAPEVKASKVAFSECDIEWTSDGLANSFNIYVNGAMYKEGLSADTQSYHVTGLATGKASTIEVEAVADEKAKGTVTVTTKGVYEYEKSTGTSFLCIGWDAPIREEMHGTTQAYQIQVFADENMSTKVYDFVPEPGGNNTQAQLFGNGSYYGYTRKVQDGVTNCTNYLTPLRVSVGGFYPNTTYYVRVRTLASFTQANGKILAHPWGDSEWSELVPMETDATRVLGTNEIIYGGFNELCVQTDYPNNCLGAINKDKATAIAWDKRPAQLFYFYHNNQWQHQADTYKLASSGKKMDGTTACLTGNAKGTGNAYIGDMEGWDWKSNCRPAMGSLGLEGDGAFVATPPLTTDKLSEDGTDCTLTFKAGIRIRINDTYTSTNDALLINVWRASTSAYETIKTLKVADLLPFDVATATTTEVYNDFVRNNISCDMKLYPGDCVELVSKCSTAPSPSTLVVDEILVVTK